jgi:hypothetical protein
MEKSQQGTMLIADITGYTMYLSQSELDHAREVLKNLLNLLIEHTKPPLVISRLAGDAVISYGLQGHAQQGQTFVEMMETTYVAFRRAIELMVLNTNCACNACKNIRALDLKFFVHFGAFGIDRLGGHDEMVGAAVNVLHRLTKNHVTEKTGLRAYILYSDEALRHLGLEEARPAMIPHEEQYEHVGAVQLWLQDMHPIWEAKKEKTHIPFPPEQIMLQVATEIHLPPEQVWDYLLRPEHFNVLAGGNKTEIARRNLGRITIGSTYQCYHGDTIFPQTILEWRPFERILVQTLAPIPVKNIVLLIDYRLEPAAQGTRLVQAFGKPAGPLHGRLMATLLFKSMARIAQRDIDNFKKHVEDDWFRLGIAPAAAPITPEMVGEAVAKSLAA